MSIKSICKCGKRAEIILKNKYKRVAICYNCYIRRGKELTRGHRYRIYLTELEQARILESNWT